LKALVLLTSILVVTAVVAVGIGIVDINNMIENPAEELGNIGTNIQDLFSQAPDEPTEDPTPPTDSGTTEDPPADNPDGDVIPVGRPWELVECDPNTIPEAPGIKAPQVGWSIWDYPVDETRPFENYKIVRHGYQVFALGNKGGLLRLDDFKWTRLETNTTNGLSNMMLGTWPSYIIGEYGTVLSYSPVTAKIERMETPWDDLDEYDRPSLYAVWGSNHENFWVLGDGLMYNYAKLTPDQQGYNASDQTPKWQWHEAPVLPWTMRGPYDKFIQDVWVNDYDSVFALVSTPGFGYYVTEWDGNEWGNVKEIPSTSLIRGIWGFAHDDIYAVGVGATVLHYNGVEWTDFENLGLDRWNSYSDIWGSGPMDLYTVGDSATTSSQLMHWDGAYWSGLPIPTDSGLYTVVGEGGSITNVYITGSDGVILRHIDPTIELGSAIGAEYDLEWITQVESQEWSYFRDSTSDGNTIYFTGLSGSDDGSLVKYGSVIQDIPLDMGGKRVQMYSVTVKDGVVYAVGRTWNEIVIVKHVITTGATSYIWDIEEESNWGPNSISVGGDGSIYVAGVSDVAIGDQFYAGYSTPIDPESQYAPYAFDAFLIKYSPQGERQWVRMWGNPDEPMPFNNLSGETVSGMEIDAQGRIIVAGTSATTSPFALGPGTWGFNLTLNSLGGGAQNGYWYVTAFNEDGELLDAQGWGMGGSYETLSSVSLTDDGQLYLTGSSNYAGKIDNQQGTSSGDLLIIKLDDQFDPLWVRYIAGDGGQFVRDAAVDGEGNLYVTGATGAHIGGQSYVGGVDIFVSKIRFDGLILGTQTLGGLEWDQGWLIELDSAGNPVVWSKVESPLVSGYTEGNSGLFWSLGDMPVDPYAECRVPYRDN